MKRTIDFGAQGVIQFTKEQLTKMCLMYLGGATIEQIASRYGISDSSVNTRLVTMGVQLRKRGPSTKVTQETMIKVWEMREAKVPWLTIARETGFNERYLQQVYKRTKSDGKNSLSLYSLPSAQETQAAS